MLKAAAIPVGAGLPANTGEACAIPLSELFTCPYIEFTVLAFSCQRACMKNPAIKAGFQFFRQPYC
jgi:hypothetical protein